MADTLLRELTNTDLDWMITSGVRERLPANQQVLSPQGTQDLIYVLIEGRLGLNFLSGTAETAQTSPLDELNQGELIGASALFNMPEIAVINTLEPSMVMSLPVAKVQEKLAEDIAFAAHFYRAIAVMLSNRLRRIFEHPDRIRFWGERSAKEVLSVFGELRDSDVDWLVSFGQIESIEAERVLLQAGRPVDAFYILLDGQLSISAPHGEFNPLYLCFSGLESSTRDQKAFATLSKGGMPGIISFLDFQPLPVTIRALNESLLFAVPRQTLVTKLQVDDSFASRFYRVIAIQVLELLKTVSTRLVDSDAMGSADDEEALDEELDIDDLTHMSEGAKKFNWMLSQLGVNRHG
ncbi:MAG: cyclic nucleotide-binding domain-containing protein [Leptolyngbya sp. SIO1D8]|nr:cyclic nucleotide-binding domain-containing protein [Leptolyngbya sp. SIO1D8]